ncbi:hypothetical protein FRC00_001258 [Tulasnella sp. 408]|nr:hypothetical protein FRC00_001258 [Tulasnella sp. 408]
MSVLSLLKLPREQFAIEIPFLLLLSTISPLVYGLKPFWWRLSSDAENRLGVYFGSLLDALLVDDTAAALDEQLKKEHGRLKYKNAKRARRETESTDARNARLVPIVLQRKSRVEPPLVFHGNTYADDMNVLSPATVLLRTPADILGQLSVGFIGPGPLKDSALKSVIRIRKSKVWDLLLWLKDNYPLYKDRLLSLDQLALYEEDGCVPGLEDATIVDTDLSAPDTFEEETAGLEAHPANLLMDKFDASGSNAPMLSSAPKRPFPATPSRSPKSTDPSTRTYKPLDATVVDESPSPSLEAVRKTSPSTPSPPTRFTRATKTGANSPAESSQYLVAIFLEFFTDADCPVCCSVPGTSM